MSTAPPDFTAQGSTAKEIASLDPDAAENIGSNPSSGPTMGDVIAIRMSRRGLVGGLLAATAIAASIEPLAIEAARAQSKGGGAATGAGTHANATSFGFKELVAGADGHLHVADGHHAQIVIRWGDPVVSGAPVFAPRAQTPSAQALQFGVNNDFLGYLPINGSSSHGLLVVNHEYVARGLMFPASGAGALPPGTITRSFADCEMMAHGGSVLEVVRTNGAWGIVADSRLNRRITAETPMAISGPGAGHALMQTKADPKGEMVKGMLCNCAGGLTPWGTWLTCEENFNAYFMGMATGADTAALKRYNIPINGYGWGHHHERFDIAKEPNESNRFGWVVEIDPFDPNSVPVKRTALGRFKHEGAGNIVNRDGRFVVYCGDDERFEYVYKFVTEGRFDPATPAANRQLLDRGTLYVARFNADGTGNWLALVHGQNGLTAANGFPDQARVVVHARLAGDQLGATRMDRPEDIDVNPKTGKVYLVLTGNPRRASSQIDAANPRADNKFGHIIEITPENGDHAATEFRWEILVKCGDPSIASVGASFNAMTSPNGWFANPDNTLIDAAGRLWVATDGNSASNTGRNDGLWAMETEGPARGTSKLFLTVPNGAELCGPMMTPDMTTLFVAIQHPGGGTGPGGPFTFDNPSTRWPDFDPNMPPRSAVVAITRKDSEVIGS